MKPDRNNDFEGVEEEMSSNCLTEKELPPPEREEDHQQEDLREENDPFFKQIVDFQICDFITNDQILNVYFPSNFLPLISDLLDTIGLASKRTIDFNIGNVIETSHTVGSNQWSNFERQVWILFSKGKRLNKHSIGVSACRPFQTFLKYYQENNRRKKTQYASAVLVLRSGECLFSPGVGPDYSKETSELKIHSEEILIGEIDEYLRSNGTKVQSIYIYTVNSPCLKRHGKEKHIRCCMLKLLHKADQWNNDYGIDTSVGFTKCWGPIGPNYFRSLTYSNISSPSSYCYLYYKEFEKTPFILDSNNFRTKVQAVHKTLSNVKPRDRENLHKDIKSAVSLLVKLAKKSSYHLKEHFLRGEKLISSFTFHAVVQNEILKILGENWKEMVRNCFMSLIREEIANVFNTAIVHAFVQELQASLGNSSPFHLYQIP